MKEKKEKFPHCLNRLGVFTVTTSEKCFHWPILPVHSFVHSFPVVLGTSLGSFLSFMHSHRSIWDHIPVKTSHGAQGRDNVIGQVGQSHGTGCSFLREDGSTQWTGWAEAWEWKVPRRWLLTHQIVNARLASSSTGKSTCWPSMRAHLLSCMWRDGSVVKSLNCS